MSDYHVGCGITGIFAGTLNTKGDRWTRKSDVTSEALAAVASYLLTHSEELQFEYQGDRFALKVEKMEGEEE